MSEKRITDNVGKTKALLLAFIMLSSLFAGGVVLIGNDNNNVDGATYGAESLDFEVISSTLLTCKVTGVKTGVTLNGDVVIPGTYTDGNTYTVVEIGDQAFNNCPGLTGVTIPDSVKKIGNFAFYKCGLATMTIPNGVEIIGSYMLGGCRNLTSVTIPDGVKTIGNNAFDNCNKLETVTIPKSVTSISYNAFLYCTKLTAIDVDGDNANYSSDTHGVLFNKDKTTLIICPGGFTGDYTIPNGVTSIGNTAFFNCLNITSVTIPSSVSNISTSGAFFYCTKLTAIDVDGDNANYSSDTHGVLFNKDKTTLIICPGGFTGDYTIPNGVTSIGDCAFYSCMGLESVTISNSVTSIGSYTFYSCMGLESVTISNSVTSIGDYAFHSCRSLTLITIPNSVTSIGYMAFADCTSLALITIPNSVTSIGDYAFHSCMSLESVTIPNSVTSIGDEVFANTISLKALAVPDTITSIGGYEGVLIKYSGANVMTATMNDDGTVNVSLPDGEKINSAKAGTTKGGNNINVSVSEGIAKLTVGNKKTVYLNVVAPSSPGQNPNDPGNDSGNGGGDDTMLYVGIAAAVAVAALALVYFLFIRKV